MAALLSVWLLVAALLSPTTLAQDGTCTASRLQLSDPPYESYFLSDCHSSSHVILTSPGSGSDASPRLLIAWPAGNSGIAAFFKPENGNSGTLGLHLENSTASGQILDSVNLPGNPNPRVGVSGFIHFDSPAILTLPILGSIRNIRDYTEGGGNLNKDAQNAVQIVKYNDDGATIYRTWFDDTTTTWLDFSPSSGADAVKIIPGDKYTVRFGTGTYRFSATFNYPQMQQLSPQQVLDEASAGLINQNPDQTISLSFLSYKEKLLAGTWRFLTYFGRDSMISALLMQPILSQGEGGAIEAVIAAVLERINRADGTVCHEEIIGDYSTLLNRQKGIKSTAPGCDYKMIDTDYFLPVLMKNYFVDTQIGKDRASDFLGTKASFLAENSGLAYSALAQLTAEKIMKTSAAFAAKGGQTVANLIHLKDGESVGEWRDSNNGLAGGRIPYDVNTALVPSALRAIAALSSAGFFPDHSDWKDTADQYAQVWEDSTLQFFQVNVGASEAKSLLSDYVSQSSFAGPSNGDDITEDVTFYGLALGSNGDVVRVMNTDDCFRHFLLNTTNQTQLSAYLGQTADNILRTFPAGLSSDVGLFVANPAYGGDASIASNFKNSDYHGTVVWSWQLAMMAAGLARQLDRCRTGDQPDFCNDGNLQKKVLTAYNHLWDLINANSDQLSGEMWSWKYDNGFQVVPFSSYSTTESDIRQLWSLTFLAIHWDNV
ncbi:hypothetical protein BU26DRAFT_315596 [Trematosphaeria pertusa]|uniref:Glycogen debranching enzyme n=1 Tax=Trematosphaeria pertusa TaxID=390896 RepID=A0A6A6II72_9PLEO|nr:uncharacterized protein BU26DRAFT_315596 [Trematosphaeria pertusa]KAF2249270.1 hypothetical protein BU26DRAFT_315596 [Trematosphaeria pertusa]